MQRPGAAEGKQRKAARILAAALEGEPQVDRHVGVDDREDAGRGSDEVEAER